MGPNCAQVLEICPGKILCLNIWRDWQPSPEFLTGEFHGQRSLVGYSQWGRKELDTTEQLTIFYPNSDSFHILFLKFFNNQFLRFYWVLEIDYTPKLFQHIYSFRNIYWVSTTWLTVVLNERIVNVQQLPLRGEVEELICRVFQLLNLNQIFAHSVWHVVYEVTSFSSIILVFYSFYFNNCTYLFILAAPAFSSWDRWRLLSPHDVWASHCGGFSSGGAGLQVGMAPVAAAGWLSNHGPRALEHMLRFCGKWS